MNTIYKTLKTLMFLLLTASAGRLQAQCTMPSTLTATQLSTCDSVSLSWAAVGGVLGYIYAYTTGPNAPSAGSAANTTTGLIGGLTPGTPYYFWVKSNCTGGSSTWKMATLTTCGSAGCQPPTNDLVNSVTTTSFNITWNPVAAAIGYEYVLDRSSNSPAGSGSATTSPSASFTGLTAGTTYNSHFRSKCGANTFSPWTNSMASTYGTMSCDPPNTVSNTIIRCDSVGISWPAVTGAQNYQYAVTQSPTPPTSGGTVVQSTVTSASKGGLLASTQYYAHVRTFCFSPGTGASGWRTQGFVTPACGGTICNAPATVTITALLPRSATISWTASAGAIGYEYVLSQTTTSPTGSGTAITTTTINLTSLNANTSYYWHMRTKCAGNQISGWKTGTLLKTPASTGISGVSANTEVFVYPNPAQSQLTVELGQKPSLAAKLGIYSIDGRRVMQLVPTLKTVLDISQLQAGMYLIRFNDININRIARFTKN